MTALNKWADLLIRREIAIDEIGRLTRPIPHGRDGAGYVTHQIVNAR
jgi:hypothetical protein